MAEDKGICSHGMARITRLSRTQVRARRGEGGVMSEFERNADGKITHMDGYTAKQHAQMDAEADRDCVYAYCSKCKMPIMEKRNCYRIDDEPYCEKCADEAGEK